MTPEFHPIVCPLSSTIHNRRGRGGPFLFIGTRTPVCLLRRFSCTVVRRTVTHSYHLHPQRSFNAHRRTFFARYKGARPRRRNRTPLVNKFVSTPSDLPRLRRLGLFRFRIRYCLPDFTSFLPSTYKCWQVTRKLCVTSQGHTRCHRPRCSCPSRSPSAQLQSNSQLMAAMRCNLVELRNSFLSHDQVIIKCFSPHPLQFSGVFAPSADGVVIKACPIHCGASTSPTGKLFPRVWLNLSYFDDRLAVSRRLTVDLDLVSV